MYLASKPRRRLPVPQLALLTCASAATLMACGESDDPLRFGQLVVLTVSSGSSSVSATAGSTGAQPPGTAPQSGTSTSATSAGPSSAVPNASSAASTATPSAIASVASSGAPPSEPSSSNSEASPNVTAAPSGSVTMPAGSSTMFPFNVKSDYCTYPSQLESADVVAAYEQWKTTVVTSEGTGSSNGDVFRIKKPDSGSVVGSTVSEGIGYGMLLAVYMNDPALFDGLWRYEQSHLNGNGLMNWEIDPNGGVIGSGGATDGDEDMAFALIMASRLWGGQGTLDDTYTNHAKQLIQAIWDHEIDHSRGDMVKAGDEWGDVDVTNPSYFAPSYYRVFGEFMGKQDDWNKVVDSSYRIINNSLNAANKNQDNGLVPAWCDSQGKPVEAYGGAPLYFQNDSTRTPFRVGQDYCYFGEPRAKDYMQKITSFYQGVGVNNIVDGYELDGTPRPERSNGGLLAASFIGPAAVGAMYSADNQAFIDEAYAELATLEATAGTIYYQKSWTALSLLMLTGNWFVVE